MELKTSICYMEHEPQSTDDLDVWPLFRIWTQLQSCASRKFLWMWHIISTSESFCNLQKCLSTQKAPCTFPEQPLPMTFPTSSTPKAFLVTLKGLCVFGMLGVYHQLKKIHSAERREFWEVRSQFWGWGESQGQPTLLRSLARITRVAGNKSILCSLWRR